MNAPDKPLKPETPEKLIARPTGEAPDAGEMVGYVMKRYPKIMARLAE